MIIKILLVAGVIGIAVGLLRGPGTGRQLALRRIVGLALGAVGVVAVLFPSLVSWVANRVGVGRGTDLVLYVGVIAFMSTTAALYQRVGSLESRITTLTRALALLEHRLDADPTAGEDRSLRGQDTGRATGQDIGRARGAR